MSVITTIEDLRVLAKRRVPKMFYDYADSGSWTESSATENFGVAKSIAKSSPYCWSPARAARNSVWPGKVNPAAATACL